MQQILSVHLSPSLVPGGFFLIHRHELCKNVKRVNSSFSRTDPNPYSDRSW